MALLLDDVQPTSSAVIISGAGSDGGYNGVRVNNERRIVFQGGPTPRQEDITGWRFDPSTPADPIRIQAQGVDLTLILPPEIASRVSGPAGASGDGSIIIEALDPQWEPGEHLAEGRSIFHFFDDSKKVGSENWSWQSEIDPLDVVGKSAIDLPAHSPGSGFIDFLGANNLILSGPSWPYDPSSGVTNVVWAVFKQIRGGINQAFSASGGNASYRMLLNPSPEAIELRNLGENELLWNGMITPEGAPDWFSVPDNYGYWKNQGSGQVPTGQAFLVMATGRHRQVTVIGGREDGSLGLNAEMFAWGFATSRPSDADVLRMQGYYAHELLNRGFISDINEFLDPGHPYEAQRPLLAGSGSSSVAVSFPATAIALTNLPISETDVYVYDLPGNTEIASLVTTGPSHSLPYVASGSDIRVQVVFPAGTFQELNLEFAVGNIPINVGAIAQPEPNYRNPNQSPGG
jgi:hypothetical protein